MKTCVLIPTYNEAKEIEGIVKKIKEEGFSLLVIDDGSSDGTADMARKSGATVLTSEKNMGKGASLKIGFIEAIENGYDSVVILDGDGQHDPGDIKRFISEAEVSGTDIVIGNRMQDPKKMPFIRYLTNRWMSIFISRMCGHTIPDTQCGFRLIRSRVLKNIKLVSSKYETESEILIKACKLGFRTSSISIKSVYKGEVSAIHPVKDIFRFIRLIIRIALESKS